MKYLNRKITLVVSILLMTHLSIYAQKVDIGHSFKGLASYYHSKFLGRKTASGEIFSRGMYTCAHRSLPFGTLIEVENTKTGRWVIVRVNDRGPYSKNRVIDLSIDAAKHLGFLEKGVAHITAKVVGFENNLELLRDGFALEFYNCFLGLEKNPLKIPYLPIETSHVSLGI
ncbi:septal ring lytic transglycosylase RlpA family protein [Leadbetterella byssophila]|nr:septal ring lytic transglycosylase RlpA family protein [Leadbetterella byssophila]